MPFGRAIFAAALAGAVSLSAAENVEDAAPAASQSLWDLIGQGGWAMWPLGFCSMVTIFLSIHAWRETGRGRFVPEGLLAGLSPVLAQGDLAAAGTLLESRDAALARSLAPVLEAAQEPSFPARERMETLVAESLERDESRVGQWVHYLNVVASVAPMIGLLGTVSGMIGAFQTISSGGMGRPELLAGDIGEALITTATGLVIGIPAMIAYFVLRNRLNNAMLGTAQAAARMLDLLGRGSRDRPAAG